MKFDFLHLKQKRREKMLLTALIGIAMISLVGMILYLFVPHYYFKCWNDGTTKE